MSLSLSQLGGGTVILAFALAVYALITGAIGATAVC